MCNAFISGTEEFSCQMLFFSPQIILPPCSYPSCAQGLEHLLSLCVYFLASGDGELSLLSEAGSPRLPPAKGVCAYCRETLQLQWERNLPLSFLTPSWTKMKKKFSLLRRCQVINLIDLFFFLVQRWGQLKRAIKSQACHARAWEVETGRPEFKVLFSSLETLRSP